MEFNEEQWERAQVKFYRLATRDSEFRKLCLEDPREAVRQVTGMELSPDVKLRFVEDEYIVQLPPVAGSELSDEQLESVAGGLKKTPGPTAGMPERPATTGFNSIQRLFIR